jgi:hypothetical protein
MIGSGSATVSGEFSILTTANSGSTLPIRVVPYNNLTGEEKTINYLNIAPTPMPTASHDSRVYRDPFIFTVSGESSFYAPAPSPTRIGYDLYSNNIFSVSGEFNSTLSFSVSGENTTIAYYGVDASGAITATQTRDFVYDTTKPTISENVMNAIGGIFITPGNAIFKKATIAPASTRTIPANGSDIEIGRFAVTAESENINIRKITLTNVATASGVDLTALISGNSVKLVDVATNVQVSAVVTIDSAGQITLDAMSAEVLQDTTRNFKILIQTQGFASTIHGQKINLSVTPVTVDRASGGVATVEATATATAITSGDYKLGVVPPVVTLTKKSANVFLVQVTNIDAESDFNLNSINARIRPVMNNDPLYTAKFCLRAEGSTITSCPISSESSSVGSIPGVSTELVLTTPQLLSKNGGSYSYEIYVDSNYVNPPTLLAEVTAVNYGSPAVTEAYMISNDTPAPVPVITPLIASLSKKSNNVFLVTISNTNAQSVVLDSITAQVKPVANGPLFDGNFCLRIE